ncbi:MAG: peptide chain release factor N(5)-glutamine methyltransferase [Planctomycetota bacterium]|nr:peptide chain release factor N(5)-glutamine methyltransferase [Planctomycetota bacterium]
MKTTSDDQWTTRTLLRWMIDHFESRGIDSPRLVAEMLLASVLECERMRLYMEADRPASQAERDTLRELVTRASKDEPVQYLLSEAWFFGQPFHVDPSVLSPRPSTETLVEHIVHELKGREDLKAPRIADIGTGSGCISTSIALNLAQATLLATDISEPALEMARKNAAKHSVADRIEFGTGSLLQPLVDRGERFDAIGSNPPYIPDHEWDSVEPNVKDYEPHGALRGGTDGLEYVRPLIEGAGEWLVPEGVLAIEIAACQEKEVIAIAKQTGWYDAIEVLKDHEGLPRVLVAKRKA